MKGSLVQRSPGTWTARFDLGPDPNGIRKQKRMTFKGTKKQAEAELARVLHELNTGGFVEPSKLTVGQLLERWLLDCAKPGVTAKTYERYEQIVRKALIPALGRISIAKLSPLHVQSFYTQLLEGGRQDGKTGGLSPTTVLQYHAILRKALQQAVKWQLVVKNVADLVDAPRAARGEQTALDAAGAQRLLSALEGSPLHLPVLMALASGCRRGELLALRWEDVNLTTGGVSVQRSLEVTKAGLAFKLPKTDRSRRSLRLPRFAVQALIRHKGEQASLRLRLGPGFQDQGLIFADLDGGPLNPDHISSRFAQWLARRPELPRVRFHDLRHTNATILFQQGEHPKVVSERLGHASVKITMDVYSHVLPGMQEAAAGRLDAAFDVAAREGAGEPRTA